MNYKHKAPRGEAYLPSYHEVPYRQDKAMELPDLYHTNPHCHSLPYYTESAYSFMLQNGKHQ